MAFMASAMLLASCADDVYDPSKEPETLPTENPFGEGFAAPDGFSWSMINTVSLNIEVKDEFNGQYQYLIEVFTSNPLTDETASPIAAGTAKQGTNYIAEVNIPQTAENFYIRQTDPKLRKEIYTYAVPENGGALSCKLYYTEVDTRAAGNSGSAFEAAKLDGFTEPEPKVYNEKDVIPEVPATSDGYVAYNPGAINAGGNFIIGKDYTYNTPFKDNIRVYNNGRATVFVQGVWDLSGKGLQSSLDIYIMNGGKIIGSGITFGGNNTLTIQSGGSIESKSGILKLGCPVKVYGSITTTNVRVNEGTPEIYIGENGSIKAVEAYFNNSQIFNYGVLSADKLELVNATILNKSDIEECKDILINGSKIFNYGDIKFNGTLTTNNNTDKAVLINHNQASMTGTEWENGASVYNDGRIQLTNFYNTAVGNIYNSCAFIIEKEFTFINLILDNGSITAGQDQATHEWLPVPTITCNQMVNLKMRNGSIIKANNFTLGNSPNSIIGETNDMSMIKVSKLSLTSGGLTTFKGNLVLEREDTQEYESWRLKVDCATTGYDESKYTIETCGGIFNEGNEGKDPSTTPEFEPTVNDANTYTYVFEDNWPAYGDFDLNDIVLTIDGRGTKEVDGGGYLKRANLDVNLEAVGASKILGVGIRFLKLPANITPTKFRVSGKDRSFEAGQSLPTLILFENAHSECGHNDERPFINTVQDATTNTNDEHNYDIIFEFDGSDNVPVSAFNINNLDVFIITKAADKKGKRTEVHVAGYAPTDLANNSLFGQGNDNSSSSAQNYYFSKENLAWGIVIPDKFAWPLEYRNIKDVYTEFASWVTSGGKEGKGWYNNSNGNVYKKKEK